MMMMIIKSIKLIQFNPMLYTMEEFFTLWFSSDHSWQKGINPFA